MAEYEARLGDLVQEGLAPFIPPKSLEKNPREYFILVNQYVEALVHINSTMEAVGRALRYVRLTRKERFWPLVADLVETVKHQMAVIERENRPALPAPAVRPPDPVLTAHDRAVAARAMALLAGHLRNGTAAQHSGREVWNQAEREVRENAG